MPFWRGSAIYIRTILRTTKNRNSAAHPIMNDKSNVSMLWGIATFVIMETSELVKLFTGQISSPDYS